MRSIVALTFVSLDGVMQAPGGKGEDSSGGFDLEGWTVPYFDETAAQLMARQMTPPLDLLLGRRTYDIFAGYWPQHEELGGGPLNAATKYVATHRDLDVDWPTTIRLRDDVVGHLRELKVGDGPTLQVHGSSDFLQTLFANDLVDELWLKIFPVTLGRGKRLFRDGVIPARFELTESTVTPGGVIFASYRRSGDVATGEF
ncbi:dihydrofolate reductase family protein [Herbiconiux sp. L3-i23]|uniref:dihydrofolate reductase family protein n=1 Tax=Herbiconiux sp. L3-i23 TaxID=2905871 RepID=UPI00205ED387|nr:dihydrofolate reductase family protein [Herbiconiux sp. L3-i23]BDI23338.1 dihydrofolate reductase [Herbiconiux sp. L3-i23]